jgi:hypothetical protein
MGDSLWVAVPSDEVLPGKVIQVEQGRREMIGALDPVDVAFISSDEDFIDTIEQVGPDVVALREHALEHGWLNLSELEHRAFRETVWIDPYPASDYELTTLSEVKARCISRQEE